VDNIAKLYIVFLFSLILSMSANLTLVDKVTDKVCLLLLMYSF